MNGLNSGDKVAFAQHFIEQMLAKGFTGTQVHAALTDPYKVTDVRRHPGQKRFCGHGVAVVLAPDGEGWRAVTLYADGVETPLRPDQMNDPAALASRRVARAHGSR